MPCRRALRRRLASAPWRARAAALALALSPAPAACVAPGSDVALAPLHTRVSTARGGVERESVAGFHLSRAPEPGAPRSLFALRPLWSEEAQPEGWKRVFLAPLGYARRRGPELTSFLIPVYIRVDTVQRDGRRRSLFAGLPGIVRVRDEDRVEWAWFPFYGRLHDVLTFQEVHFVLWPLYVATERAEGRSWNVLFPVLHRKRGPEVDAWRVWPLAGRKQKEGSYDRWFVLWPIFHRQRGGLGEGEVSSSSWMVFPLLGHAARGSYDAWTVAWPFLGYAREPESDFVAVDAPWPLVRFQRGGHEGVRRSRVWPFYGHLETPTLDYRQYAWPLVHARTETYARATRESLYVVPFWQSWDRTDTRTGDASRWRKLWPLYQEERDGERSRGSFPALDPLWRGSPLDEHYSWLWRVFEWEEEEELRRERSLAGLWRRERGPREDRRYLSFLWSRRSFGTPAEGEVAETSLLFGLLRWRRSEANGTEWLRPAFPGPGWPAERVGRTPAGAPEPPPAPPE